MNVKKELHEPITVQVTLKGFSKSTVINHQEEYNNKTGRYLSKQRAICQLIVMGDEAKKYGIG